LSLVAVLVVQEIVVTTLVVAVELVDYSTDHQTLLLLAPIQLLLVLVVLVLMA
jgi:hypothetical protein